jgi:hypothetical protein
MCCVLFWFKNFDTAKIFVSTAGALHNSGKELHYSHLAGRWITPMILPEFLLLLWCEGARQSSIASTAF